MFLWTDEEKTLRKQGAVVWRPLNLEVGDVETKGNLVADFAAGGARDITRFCISPPILQQEMSSSEHRAWWVAQRMMRRKTNRWDREEAEPESDWASLLGGMVRGQARPTNKDKATDVARLNGPDDNKENEQSHHRVHLSMDIEAQSQRWVSAFRQVRQEQYERDVKTLGTFEAHKKDSRWKLDGPKIITGVHSFFKEKQIFLEKERKRGNDEDEAEQYASWESARILDEESRDLLEEFIPGVLLPVTTRSEAEM